MLSNSEGNFRYTLVRAFSFLFSLSDWSEVLSNSMRNLFAVTATVILLTQLLSPNLASASCGDYLHGAKRDVAGGSMQVHDPAAPYDAPRSPCQGAHCGKNPSPILPAAPGKTLVLEVDEFGFLQIARYQIDAGLKRRALESNAQSLLGFRLRIERPPRLS